MEKLIGDTADLILAHRAWAGPIMGLLAFGESLALVGMLIPATAIMFAVGGMIGLGLVEAWQVLLGGIVGAVLGDWLSYALGGWLGPQAYRRWPLNRHMAAVARARLFFRRFGFTAVLLGRLFGPIRATIPVVAGVMRMPARRFQLANVLSAVIWVPGIFAPGYLATRGMGSPGHIGPAQLATIGTVTIVFTVLGMVMAGFLMRGRRARRPRAKGTAAR